MIWGDYHTHTKNSDGKGTVVDTLKAADKIGLKQVGISDHGFRHIAQGMSFKEVEKTRREIEDNKSKFNVQCLLSIEANIFTDNGQLDLKPQDYDLFDYIVAGYHKVAVAKNIAQFFKFNLPALFADIGSYTNAQRKKYTKAIVGAIKSGKINILAHLNYGVPAFVEEVGKAALDFGTYIELNGKKVSMTDDEVAKLNALGVRFLINSDAHSPERVGEISVPLAVCERVGIDKSRIFNWQKLPEDLKIRR